MQSGWAGSNPFSIILPTLNEGDNIVPMLETLVGLYPKASILVMDDNSKDGTAQKAREFAAKGHDVTVVSRDPSDKGLTASIFDGIMHSKTDFFVVMDSDFQHPPTSVGELIEKMHEGSDMAIGVREDKVELSSARMMASWAANAMASSYLRWKRQPRSSDIMSGFFSGRTQLCQKVIRENDGKFERKGFKGLFDLLKFVPRDAKISEVVFKFNSRRSGESKLSSTIIISIMRQCGIWGKALAAATTFFIIDIRGRYLAALLLGLLFTFGVLRLTNTILTADMINSMLLAIFLSISYLVIANRLLSNVGRRDGIVQGAKLVFTGFSGYLISLYAFYWVFSDINTVQMLSLFLGFGIGFLYDSSSMIFKK
ncbi:MAG: Glycosyltransferase AglE [Methanomassiliicoccales archaeon PtaU1.Bin124]|nr:MAG: Glycosyltransferase AglE [Methanomassiliicoccales archaeon PtaU1.Bin124]